MGGLIIHKANIIPKMHLQSRMLWTLALENFAMILDQILLSKHARSSSARIKFFQALYIIIIRQITKLPMRT